MGRKILIAGLAGLAGVILAVPALADTRAGVDAWTRGDFATAVREWQTEAGRGDADALFNLGQAYKLGKGVPQDLAKAEQLFGQASARGHIQASDNYGLLLFQRGERAQALPYLRAAADRGDPRAQYLLGISHFNGQLVPKDWVRAYALVSLAQQQGLAQAGPALAEMDKYVPIEQRQQAVAMAAELQSQADATRARQLAAADLGNNVPAAAAPLPPAPIRTPSMASGSDVISQASRVAGNSSPATAGADYARPAAPNPPRQVAVAPPPQPVRTWTPAPSAPAAAPAAAPVSSGAWRLQLGAFGVMANADALWARIKARPEIAGHPRINIRAGAVTKLQAGGYASQAAAQAACRTMVAAGYTCIAVSS